MTTEEYQILLASLQRRRDALDRREEIMNHTIVTLRQIIQKLFTADMKTHPDLTIALSTADYLLSTLVESSTLNHSQQNEIEEPPSFMNLPAQD